MSESKTEIINSQLERLRMLDGAEGSAVVARNGLLVASNLPNNVDEKRFCAMIATMMGAVETAANTLNRGRLSRITAEMDGAIMIAMGAGDKTLLVSVSRKEANLGMLMIEMEECAGIVSDAMGVG